MVYVCKSEFFVTGREREWCMMFTYVSVVCVCVRESVRERARERERERERRKNEEEWPTYMNS